MLAAPGFGESSTDATYSGLCLITEDGKVLERAEDGCSDIVTELDVQLLIAARRKDATFTGDAASYVVTEWGEGVEETVLTRPFGKYPRTAVVTRQAESVAIGKPAISTSTVAPASA